MSRTSTSPTVRTTEAIVAAATDMAVGSMKAAKVGERRVVVIRSSSGFHALDNACPHQGYGMATGSLDGELLTCQWHNWKFRVSDGTCILGEEDITCHKVRVDDGNVVVEVTEPTSEETLAKLWPSLRRGIERDYRGQMARDTARLLNAGASPESIVEAGLRHSLPRNEWGLGHDMAVAADLLMLSDRFEGLDKTVPLAQALSGFSEQSRDRVPHEVPSDAPAEPHQAAFVAAIENEDAPLAVNTLRALLRSRRPEADLVAEAQRWLVDAVSRHHYDYGHGAIYTQKAFELIDRIPQITEQLLIELTLTLVYGTREDTLPYMRKANRAIDKVDLDGLAGTEANPSFDSEHTDALVALLLDAPQAPIEELVAAAHNGCGVQGLLNVISLTAAHRMLRFDLTVERDRHEVFGWLDLTHVMTYLNAARWAWRIDPGPNAARLVLLTAFLAFDSGRHERRTSQGDVTLPNAEPGSIFDAVVQQRPDDAISFVLASSAPDAGEQLTRASLEDTAGSFIVMAHLVKTSVAAGDEAAATGSMLPLAAAARFLASSRAERFVTVGARAAIDFVRTGQPGHR